MTPETIHRPPDSALVRVTIATYNAPTVRLVEADGYEPAVTALIQNCEPLPISLRERWSVMEHRHGTESEQLGTRNSLDPSAYVRCCSTCLQQARFNWNIGGCQLAVARNTRWNSLTSSQIPATRTPIEAFGLATPYQGYATRLTSQSLRHQSFVSWEFV